MASELKSFFDASVVRRIARDLRAVHPAFPHRAFEADAKAGLERLELMDRARHLAGALRRHLPPEPTRALNILVGSLGPPLSATSGHGMAPFLYLPHVLFVAEHGLTCFEAAMRAQHALTQRFSAEFSIRRFLEHAPRRTLARLKEWTADPSPHVRRLVSEGIRPRLPWAGRLRAFERDPTPVLRLLERLKDDPELYVRRSVANCLNDVGKAHPERLRSVAGRWLRGATPERRDLVEHALRTLVKEGDPAALRLLGYGPAPQVVVVGARVIPSQPQIGGHVDVLLDLENRGPRAVAAVVDLGVHFVKRGGQARVKVFKVRALRMDPGGRHALRKRVSLAQHTTRSHYPGRHVVDVRVNGRVLPIEGFVLRG